MFKTEVEITKIDTSAKLGYGQVCVKCEKYPTGVWLDWGVNFTSVEPQVGLKYVAAIVEEHELAVDFGLLILLYVIEPPAAPPPDSNRKVIGKSSHFIVTALPRMSESPNLGGPPGLPQDLPLHEQFVYASQISLLQHASQEQVLTAYKELLWLHLVYKNTIKHLLKDNLNGTQTQDT